VGGGFGQKSHKKGKFGPEIVISDFETLLQVLSPFQLQHVVTTLPPVQIQRDSWGNVMGLWKDQMALVGIDTTAFDKEMETQATASKDGREKQGNVDKIENKKEQFKDKKKQFLSPKDKSDEGLNDEILGQSSTKSVISTTLPSILFETRQKFNKIISSTNLHVAKPQLAAVIDGVYGYEPIQVNEEHRRFSNTRTSPLLKEIQHRHKFQCNLGTAVDKIVEDYNRNVDEWGKQNGWDVDLEDDFSPSGQNIAKNGQNGPKIDKSTDNRQRSAGGDHDTVTTTPTPHSPHTKRPTSSISTTHSTTSANSTDQTSSRDGGNGSRDEAGEGPNAQTYQNFGENDQFFDENGENAEIEAPLHILLMEKFHSIIGLDDAELTTYLDYSQDPEGWEAEQRLKLEEMEAWNQIPEGGEGQQWDQNGQNMAQNGQNMTQNGQKMVQNGQDISQPGQNFNAKLSQLSTTQQFGGQYGGSDAFPRSKQQAMPRSQITTTKNGPNSLQNGPNSLSKASPTSPTSHQRSASFSRPGSARGVVGSGTDTASSAILSPLSQYRQKQAEISWKDQLGGQGGQLVFQQSPSAPSSIPDHLIGENQFGHLTLQLRSNQGHFDSNPQQPSPSTQPRQDKQQTQQLKQSKQTTQPTIPTTTTSSKPQISPHLQDPDLLTLLQYNDRYDPYNETFGYYSTPEPLQLPLRLIQSSPQSLANRPKHLQNVNRLHYVLGKRGISFEFGGKGAGGDENAHQQTLYPILVKLASKTLSKRTPFTTSNSTVDFHLGPAVGEGGENGFGVNGANTQQIPLNVSQSLLSVIQGTGLYVTGGGEISDFEKIVNLEEKKSKLIFDRDLSPNSGQFQTTSPRLRNDSDLDNDDSNRLEQGHLVEQGDLYALPTVPIPNFISTIQSRFQAHHKYYIAQREKKLEMKRNGQNLNKNGQNGSKSKSKCLKKPLFTNFPDLITPPQLDIDFPAFRMAREYQVRTQERIAKADAKRMEQQEQQLQREQQHSQLSSYHNHNNQQTTTTSGTQNNNQTFKQNNFGPEFTTKQPLAHNLGPETTSKKSLVGINKTDDKKGLIWNGANWVKLSVKLDANPIHDPIPSSQAENILNRTINAPNDKSNDMMKLGGGGGNDSRTKMTEKEYEDGYIRKSKRATNDQLSNFYDDDDRGEQKDQFINTQDGSKNNSMDKNGQGGAQNTAQQGLIMGGGNKNTSNNSGLMGGKKNNSSLNSVPQSLESEEDLLNHDDYGLGLDSNDQFTKQPYNEQENEKNSARFTKQPYNEQQNENNYNEQQNDKHSASNTTSPDKNPTTNLPTSFSPQDSDWDLSHPRNQSNYQDPNDSTSVPTRIVDSNNYSAPTQDDMQIARSLLTLASLNDQPWEDCIDDPHHDFQSPVTPTGLITTPTHYNNIPITHITQHPDDIAADDEAHNQKQRIVNNKINKGIGKAKDGGIAGKKGKLIQLLKNNSSDELEPILPPSATTPTHAATAVDIIGGGVDSGEIELEEDFYDGFGEDDDEDDDDNQDDENDQNLEENVQNIDQSDLDEDLDDETDLDEDFDDKHSFDEDFDDDEDDDDDDDGEDDGHQVNPNLDPFNSNLDSFFETGTTAPQLSKPTATTTTTTTRTHQTNNLGLSWDHTHFDGDEDRLAKNFFDNSSQSPDQHPNISQSPEQQQSEQGGQPQLEGTDQKQLDETFPQQQGIENPTQPLQPPQQQPQQPQQQTSTQSLAPYSLEDSCRPFLSTLSIPANTVNEFQDFTFDDLLSLHYDDLLTMVPNPQVVSTIYLGLLKYKQRWGLD
jgi:hypothetical protein